MLYCTYDMLNMFQALLCPSSGALDYMCILAAYGVQCLVAGCRGQVQGSRVCIQEEGCCMSWVSKAVRKLLPSASCTKPLAHHTSGNQSPASPYKDLCSIPRTACARFVVDIVVIRQAVLSKFWFSTLHYYLNNASYTPIGRHVWGCSTYGLRQNPLTNRTISTNCPEIYSPPKNFRCQKDDMQ
jgi:hypothetical protein